MTTEQDAAAVQLTVADHIAEISFNRPRVLNAIDVATASAFRDAVAAVKADPTVRVVVLTGAGRAFMAGGDLGYFRDAGEDAPAAARRLIAPIHDGILMLSAMSQPVLACLQGAIAGAGMSVALAADLAIAADDVVFNMAYIKIGATPDCSGSWSLPRLVGARKALEIALLADNLDAAEARRLGLVNWIVPRDELRSRAWAIARRLAEAPPVAVSGIKQLFSASLHNTLQAQLEAEENTFARCAETRDFREALAAFFEKRTPQFEGH